MLLPKRSVQAAILSGVFALFGTLFCILRMWTRVMILRAVGWEDLVLVLSWVFSILILVATGFQFHYGLGEHATALSPEQLQSLNNSVYLAIIAYCASIGLTKIAILMQYQRVFPIRKFQYWCWSVLAIVVAFTIATVLVSIFPCSPLRTIWQDGEGTCIDSIASWFSNAVVNIVTDLMIIILPMPVIKKLNLAKRQKWLLIGAFGFGGVVCVISIFRLHPLFIIATSTDPSYDNVMIAAFSIVEVNVAIMSACIPTLKPLIASCFRRVAPSSRSVQWGFTRTRSHIISRQASTIPAGGDCNLGLERISTTGDTEPLEEESDTENRIRVVTRVDVKTHGRDTQSTDGSSKTSTESLHRSIAEIV